MALVPFYILPLSFHVYLKHVTSCRTFNPFSPRQWKGHNWPTVLSVVLQIWQSGIFQSYLEQMGARPHPTGHHSQRSAWGRQLGT